MTICLHVPSLAILSLCGQHLVRALLLILLNMLRDFRRQVRSRLTRRRNGNIYLMTLNTPSIMPTYFLWEVSVWKGIKLERAWFVKKFYACDASESMDPTSRAIGWSLSKAGYGEWSWSQSVTLDSKLCVGWKHRWRVHPCPYPRKYSWLYSSHHEPRWNILNQLGTIMTNHSLSSMIWGT